MAETTTTEVRIKAPPEKIWGRACPLRRRLPMGLHHRAVPLRDRSQQGRRQWDDPQAPDESGTQGEGGRRGRQGHPVCIRPQQGRDEGPSPDEIRVPGLGGYPYRRRVAGHCDLRLSGQVRASRLAVRRPAPREGLPGDGAESRRPQASRRNRRAGRKRASRARTSEGSARSRTAKGSAPPPSGGPSGGNSVTHRRWILGLIAIVLMFSLLSGAFRSGPSEDTSLSDLIARVESSPSTIEEVRLPPERSGDRSDARGRHEGQDQLPDPGGPDRLPGEARGGGRPLRLERHGNVDSRADPDRSAADSADHRRRHLPDAARAGRWGFEHLQLRQEPSKGRQPRPAHREVHRRSRRGRGDRGAPGDQGVPGETPRSSVSWARASRRACC